MFFPPNPPLDTEEGEEVKKTDYNKSTINFSPVGGVLYKSLEKSRFFPLVDFDGNSGILYQNQVD